MKTLHIYATDESPDIHFNPFMGFLEFSGKSLPEDIKSFYQPVEDAIKKYIEKPQQKTIINMRFDYLNSASTRRILEILMPLEQLHRNGLYVEINWYYRELDEEMQEEGEEFARLIEIPVNIISLNI